MAFDGLENIDPNDPAAMLQALGADCYDNHNAAAHMASGFMQCGTANPMGLSGIYTPSNGFDLLSEQLPVAGPTLSFNSASILPTAEPNPAQEYTLNLSAPGVS